MRTEFKKIVFVIALTLCASLTAYGDWQSSDGWKMHYPQLPNPMGWDIDLRPYELADDWQCTKTGDVNDIHFWISWKGDLLTQILNIQVNIYSNDPNVPSKPATQLWSRPAYYDFTIKPIDPNGSEGYWIPTGPNSQTLSYNDHNHYYQINMKNIQNPFHQVEGQIYWLSLRITAQQVSDPNKRVGWKTSLNHFMDAAVAKYGTSPGWKPLYEPNSTTPIDFSFVITGGPNEPPDTDFGDAPDSDVTPGYPTLLINNGARHTVGAGNILLGALVDKEQNGQPTANADGDDLNPPAGPDDEDGVIFPVPLIPGQPSSVTVTTSAPGNLDAWIDFVGDGSWAQPIDQIATALPLPAGVHIVNFIVPAAATPGLTYARFRYSSTVGGLPPTGPAIDGEVEDYNVFIEPSETNEPNYPTDAKWLQKPDLSTNGVDVMACDNLTLADDFNCNEKTKITDITIWGSWLNDILPTGGPNIPFTLSIHSDIPANPDPCGGNAYSTPGPKLWYTTIMPSEVSIHRRDINEGWFNPATGSSGGYQYIPIGDHNCWKYVFHIPEANAFSQQGEPNKPIVYWLDVHAHTDTNIASFGWKTSINHWNDDAVYGIGYGPNIGFWYELIYPLEHPSHPNSIDLAFAIEGNIPETPAKWRQNPDLSTNGLDVMASEPFILADDFECNVSTFITDITIWGSWKNDIIPLGGPNDLSFILSFHSDIPAGPNTSFSRPGGVLWYRNFAPGTFVTSLEAPAINEGWWDPNSSEYIPIGDHICWKYEFHIPEANAFCQQGGSNKITYWLDVKALPNDPNAKFGWKSSINHWNDDAVWGKGSEPYVGPWNELRYPPLHPLDYNSIDLAFVIDGITPCNVPPGQATNPNPVNGATNVHLIQTLSWTAGAAATSHDVYFGTTSPPPFKTTLPQLTTTYDPGPLTRNTIFHWRIDERNPCGITTGVPLTFTTVSKCMKPLAPEYNDWVRWGEPNCWCCKRQCRGDFDCSKKGPYWVSASDLNLLKLCFNKSDTQIKGMTNCICADCDHKKVGPYRIQASDLNCLKAYYNRSETQVPCCDKDKDCILDCNMPPAGDNLYFWTN